MVVARKIMALVAFLALVSQKVEHLAFDEVIYPPKTALGTEELLKAL